MPQLVMQPATGERLLCFVGDRVRFTLRCADGRPPAAGWSARLRTNLGRAAQLRAEIIAAPFQKLPLAGASWRDIPMRQAGGEWFIELPLAEIGYFKAKAYALDPQGWQYWPDGPDAGISVHPDSCRTANTIYCAFVRLFGETKAALAVRDEKCEAQFKQLDQQGYALIPPSGKLRDLTRQLPHIIDTLGCRIIHLLPVNPTPTTYARFGRYGSPYACEDLTAIDPALVEFDQRTTGVDQFRELTCAAHSKGARVFLDLVVNHTGWGSTLQENHPDWFLRHPDGSFASPGAWGVTWEDLVELDQRFPELWEQFAEAFLTWCRRGVDGFRCDAGYKVPAHVWQYIVARVREEFPEAIFLLEGLGGAWFATETLLTEGGMQWAYSELFQEYSGLQVAGYLDHSFKQSQRVGMLVHYSETHDNDRLAKRGRAWSLMRNRLCALASVGGGYGFTCGGEWLATEKIIVHRNAGLNWDGADNLVREIAWLNRLLAGHPCFFDGAKFTRLSPADSPVYALLRESAEGKDKVLVLVNTEMEKPHDVTLDLSSLRSDGGRPVHDFFEKRAVDLLGQSPPKFKPDAEGKVTLTLAPAACHCLSPGVKPAGLSGDAYRRARAQAAWALTALNQVLPMEEIGACDWRELAGWVDRDARRFLGSLAGLDPARAGDDLPAALEAALRADTYSHVVTWSLIDRRRITLIPPKHWLLLQDVAPFRARLRASGEMHSCNVQSVPVRAGHVACFAPPRTSGEAELVLERHAADDPLVTATVRFLAARPEDNQRQAIHHPLSTTVLLTNGIGGMARLCVDLGRINSKYDCVLGANLHPSLPVDRHIFVKRVRVWVNADGFITPLNGENLIEFESGPPARWRFTAGAGDGRSVQVELEAAMLDQRNTTVLRFARPQAAPPTGCGGPPEFDVRLTVRFDIEDRNFHHETKRNGGSELHFTTHTRPLADGIGFAFAPATDRRLRVFSDSGVFHPQPEWSENIPHPVEASRGQVASGDAYSPGWFDLPMPQGSRVTLVAGANDEEVQISSSDFAMARPDVPSANEDAFGRRLARSAHAFVVRRDEGKTVIAGYPWFLDWGRDTLICARGLLTAGLVDEVKKILVTFGRFEASGTLPNTIHGANASNRDTSDAPLWYGLLCEDLAAADSPARAPSEPGGRRGRLLYDLVVDRQGRTIADILRSIAVNYSRGTPNGIRMDATSGLIWSPSHFTWMDTNFPACTPREGYPVEIQVLWIRLLRQLERVGVKAESESWSRLADRAEAAFNQYFWLEDAGYFADALMAKPDAPARSAAPDNALRSNYLLAVSLGLATGERGRRGVDAALRYLVVPGALRSLAPLRVSPPAPIYAGDGHLLNEPTEPYQGTYEGDEDTCRKPAYHNGTAWTWTFPILCEALVRAWDFSPEAVAAAQAYLGSVAPMLAEGCLDHLPEIVDGDAPHTQRGCDAQAWGATEALRVWKWLNEITPSSPRGP